MNPYLSIWFKPRKTMQYIMDFDPDLSLKGLSVIFASISIIAGMNNLEGLFVSLLLFPFLCAIFYGLIHEVFPRVLLWSTDYFGGQANLRLIRSSIILSFFPLIISYLIIIFVNLLTLISGGEALVNEKIMSGLDSFFSLWALILSLKTLSEICSFSIWKAFVSNILLYILFSIFVLLSLKLFSYF